MKHALWIAALMLAGCSSGKPTVLLRLVAVAPTEPPRAAPGAAVAVAPLELPATLDRSEFVTSNGGTALRAEAGAEWAGGLSEMARGVLAQDLARRLRQTTVLMPGDPVPPEGVRTVHVVVQTFLADASGAVTLQADWWLAQGGSATPAQRGRFVRTLPGPPGPPDEAKTMSRALGALSDTIASAL